MGGVAEDDVAEGFGVGQILLFVRPDDDTGTAPDLGVVDSADNN